MDLHLSQAPDENKKISADFRIFYPELFTNPFFTVNTGRHKKLSFAAVFSYKQNNQKFICQRLKRVNNAGYRTYAAEI
jgi:hypothetical protein